VKPSLVLVSSALVCSSERQWLGVRVTAGSVPLDHASLVCVRCTGLTLAGDAVVCASGSLHPAPAEEDGAYRLPSLPAGASLVAWLAVLCSEAAPQVLLAASLRSASGVVTETLRAAAVAPFAVTACSQHLPSGAVLQVLLSSQLSAPATILAVALDAASSVPLHLPARLRPEGLLAALFLLQPSAQREGRLTLEYELPGCDGCPPPDGPRIAVLRVPLPVALSARITATQSPCLGCVGESMRFGWHVQPVVEQPLRWEVSAAPADWLLLSPQEGAVTGAQLVEACLVPLRAGTAPPPTLLLHSADGLVGGEELAPLASPVRVLPAHWTRD